MSGRFIKRDDIEREQFDWGEIGWVSRPDFTGSDTLCVMDVTLQAGGGHAFHKHPDQDEVIWVREGRIEQWIDQDHTDLGPGEAVYIARDVVHASYNTGDGDVKLSVMLSPTAGPGGYELVDVSEDEPWASLRSQ
jgi:quercetin dioxygenase-like cupin family protein